MIVSGSMHLKSCANTQFMLMHSDWASKCKVKRCTHYWNCPHLGSRVDKDFLLIVSFIILSSEIRWTDVTCNPGFQSDLLEVGIETFQLIIRVWKCFICHCTEHVQNCFISNSPGILSLGRVRHLHKSRFGWLLDLTDAVPLHDYCHVLGGYLCSNDRAEIVSF